MKKLLAVLLFLGLCGCVHSGVRSDFGAFSNTIYPAKTEQEEVLLMTEMPQRPYKEIGLITIEERRHTPLNAINQEILRIAREVGADAVIKLQYSGGERMTGMVDGEVMSMTSRKQATGVAIVFTDKK
jgi:hypothetical protein